MKGYPVKYSDAEMAWLEANRMMVISDYRKEFVARFGRADVSMVHLNSLRKRKGWKTGRTGCFEKGAEPVNKGKSCAPGTGGRHPNAQRTQFKKGGRTGRANMLYKPIGTERFSKEGYLERKIHDGLPLQSRWRAVHLVNWESVNGPIPKGRCLKCLDGDKTNTAPENWESVPRAMLPRLNGGRHKTRIAFDHAPVELKPTIMALAKLEHKISEAAE